MGNTLNNKSQNAVDLTENDIQLLMCNTSFDREQIQDWHRGFLRDCPKGLMNREKFIEIYGLLYPQGNAKKFSKQVFKVFDNNNSGYIDFKELMLCMSVTTEGDLRKKLELTFKLFDLNSNGYIDEKEITIILDAIYELLDYDKTGSNSPKERVKIIMSKLDRDNDKKLSHDEFIDGLISDPVLREILMPMSSS